MGCNALIDVCDNTVKLEPIELLRHAPFDLGMAMRYLLMGHEIGDPESNFAHARFYLECAKETSEFKSKPYRDFFENYGNIVLLFFPMVKKHHDFLCYDVVIGELEDYTLEELKGIREKILTVNKESRRTQ